VFVATARTSNSRSARRISVAGVALVLYRS
jgi:hypothetical protein